MVAASSEAKAPLRSTILQGNDLGQLDGNPSKAVAVDPADDHVYVDEGSRVVEFELNTAEPAESKTVGPPIGAGLLEGSYSMTADSGTLEVSNPGTSKVATFGPAAVPPEPRTDNPLVIDSVSSPDARNGADFEVTPSGNDAVFTSTLPLTEYDNAEVHREIFRYEAGSGLNCASCNPTGEQATGEASLPADGLGLTDDGRVFFDSTEGLVDRDLNNELDAYQWESGKGTELISTGTSSGASSLAGVSADGTDAFFFTHDTLVPEDENGSRVKVYDARAFGGLSDRPAAGPLQRLRRVSWPRQSGTAFALHQHDRRHARWQRTGGRPLQEGDRQGARQMCETPPQAAPPPQTSQPPPRR